MEKADVEVLKTHDHRKIYKDIYQIKPDQTIILQLPELKFVSQSMVTSYDMSWDGRPEPVDEKWLAWKVVNQIKQYTRKKLAYKFKNMPPEVIWHELKEGGKWRVDQMMLVADCVNEEMFDWAIARVQKNLRVKELPTITFEKTPPTLCAQRLHVGHYKDAHLMLQEMEKDVEKHGYRIIGPRREIYLLPAMGCYPASNSKTILRVELEEVSS